MLLNLLPESRANHEVFWTATKQLAWCDLRDAVRCEASQLPQLANTRVAMLLSPTVEAMVRLLALDSLECDISLLSAETPLSQALEWGQQFGWSWIVGPIDQPIVVGSSIHLPPSADRLTILTSGTTGAPKAVEHTWRSLSRPVRSQTGLTPPRWLLTFRPHLYAGLQVMLQCLLNQGTLVMPQQFAAPIEVVKNAARAHVAYASATPSYWRWLLHFVSFDELQTIPLQQITLGGESVDQPTLDNLANTFPNARLIHIYATTELGRCFSVTDGRSGFPVSYLNRVSDDGIELKVVDDELLVKSANAMSGYLATPLARGPQDWFHTNDLVKVSGDRVFFVGRRSDMLNVGGNKVYPQEVESVLRSVLGVADARVLGEPSSILGQLVKCEIVLVSGHDPLVVEHRIREQTDKQLASYQRPRWISFVDEIPKTSAGKAQRTEPPK